MKKLFLGFIVLLLFPVLNIEATNIVIKVDKQSSTNSSFAKKVANKEKVDKKKAVFDKNLNVALLTDEELNQLINNALLNCDNAELMELGIKLQKALKFDWTPIISSAILARTKCDLKKSQQKCVYALDNFHSEFMSGKFSDETKKTMDEAIDGVPIGCQDWKTVNYLAGTTGPAMNLAIRGDNDFDKAWAIYENTLLAIKACKNGSVREKKWAINGTIHRNITHSIGQITRHKNQNKIKLSLETAKEMKKLIGQLPTKDFTGGLEYKQNLLDGEIMRQDILKELQKYIDQK